MSKADREKYGLCSDLCRPTCDTCTGSGSPAKLTECARGTHATLDDALGCDRCQTAARAALRGSARPDAVPAPYGLRAEDVLRKLPTGEWRFASPRLGHLSTTERSRLVAMLVEAVYSAGR